MRESKKKCLRTLLDPLSEFNIQNLFFQKPLNLGADIVVHSLTKYVNGHSDVIMGAVVTNDDKLYEKLKFLQNGTNRPKLNHRRTEGAVKRGPLLSKKTEPSGEQRSQ